MASEVPSAGSGSPESAGEPRVGRGLAGMRERAHLAGGWVTAGPDGEHYRVTVFIPYGAGISDAGGTADEDTGSQLVSAGPSAVLPDGSRVEAGVRG
ncbi:hypothetical protein RCH07_002964 [Arthrobacter sp. CG_A4]|nr:hypothetical protein [Arthrobacter sp. CG_A4]